MTIIVKTFLNGFESKLIIHLNGEVKFFSDELITSMLIRCTGLHRVVL